MTSTEYGSHFSIANIPFGVASSKSRPSRQCVTRLENTVIFLAELQRQGLFAGIAGLPEGVFEKPTLNEYAALAKSTQREVRTILQQALKDLSLANVSEHISAVTLHLPVAVGGFTGMPETNLGSMLTSLNRPRFFLQPAPCQERRSSDHQRSHSASRILSFPHRVHWSCKHGRSLRNPDRPASRSLL